MTRGSEGLAPWDFMTWVSCDVDVEPARPQRQSSGIPDNQELVPEGQRTCPICGEQMLSSRRYGVLIDVCEAHGLWLDKGELAMVVRQIHEADIRSHIEQLEVEAEKLERVMELLTSVLKSAR